VIKGKAIFDAQGCGGCHGISGTPSHGAPDLTAEWKRHQDPAWYAKFIRNPSAMKPGTIMPAFNILTDADLAAIAEYLRKPKGQ
jgi:cytochrome c oxidase subunit 2